MFALIFAIIFILVALELAYWLLAFVLLWAVPFAVALLVGLYITRQHFGHELAPLWALLGVALLGRFFVGGIGAYFVGRRM